jgi:hypothetical protein
MRELLFVLISAKEAIRRAEFAGKNQSGYDSNFFISGIENALNDVRMSSGPEREVNIKMLERIIRKSDKSINTDTFHAFNDFDREERKKRKNRDCRT